MLIVRRALLNYGQSMSDRKHDKYLRISHRVRSPIRSANNHSNSMLCIMNQAYQKIAIQYDRTKICTIHLLTYMGVFLLMHSTLASSDGCSYDRNYGSYYYYYLSTRSLCRVFFDLCLSLGVGVKNVKGIKGVK